jgi:hypothetical protein
MKHAHQLAKATGVSAYALTHGPGGPVIGRLVSVLGSVEWTSTVWCDVWPLESQAFWSTAVEGSGNFSGPFTNRDLYANESRFDAVVKALYGRGCPQRGDDRFFTEGIYRLEWREVLEKYGVGVVSIL